MMTDWLKRRFLKNIKEKMKKLVFFSIKSEYTSFLAEKGHFVSFE